MVETKLKKGDIVKHTRGKVIENNILVSSAVEKPKNIKGIVIANYPQSYIIEHPNGWTPNYIRKMKYGLDSNKKYLFVLEKEIE